MIKPLLQGNCRQNTFASPSVMPSDFLSPSYDNISAVATMDIDGPVANKDTEDPSVSHDSSPVATMDNYNAVATKDTNDSSNTHDNSSPMATKDTGDQSVTHGNSSQSTIHGDNHSPIDLVVIHWGGTTSSGIQLANTCPIDNWLMILQALVKSRRMVLDELDNVGNIIRSALFLVDLKRYGDAKVTLPQTPVIKHGIIDFYGNESDYFISLSQPFLATTITSSCNLSTCPSMIKTQISHGIAPGCNDNNNTFVHSLDEWFHLRMNPCQRNFQSKLPVSIPSQPDVTLNCDGTQTVSWHCPGFRTSTPRSFSCFKKFFIFSVDLLSRRTHLRTKDLPSTITLNGKLLNLHSATLWGGGHYICMFNYANTWLLYNGLKEQRQIHSGLSVFNGQPNRFLVSHALYIK